MWRDLLPLEAMEITFSKHRQRYKNFFVGALSVLGRMQVSGLSSLTFFCSRIVHFVRFVKKREQKRTNLDLGVLQSPDDNLAECQQLFVSDVCPPTGSDRRERRGGDSGVQAAGEGTGGCRADVLAPTRSPHERHKTLCQPRTLGKRAWSPKGWKPPSLREYAGLVACGLV